MAHANGKDGPPLVSVVIPSYNRGSRVVDAIASANAQSLADLEVILVDDASESTQRPDPDSLQGSRIRIVQRDANGGVAAAQNSGLAAARGEFIAFLHSDDTWEPTKLAHQVDALAASPKAVAVESATIRLTDDGDVPMPPALRNATEDQFFAREIRNLHISGFLFRRATLDRLGGFDERLRSYEDFELLVRVLRHGGVVTTDDVVARVDQRSGDRLAESPWMPRARQTLLDIYADELIGRFGRLPDGWRDWAVQLAAGSLVAGERRRARTLVRLSTRGRRSELVKRSPLLVASYLGPRAASRIGARFERSWAA